MGTQITFRSKKQPLEVSLRASADRALLLLKRDANLLRHVNIMFKFVSRQTRAEIAVCGDFVSNATNYRKAGEVNSVFVVLCKASAREICRGHNSGPYVRDVHFRVEFG